MNSGDTLRDLTVSDKLTFQQQNFFSSRIKLSDIKVLYKCWGRKFAQKTIEEMWWAFSKKKQFSPLSFPSND